MRIGLFILMAGRNAGGPETYEVELLRAMAKLDRTNEYIVYHTTPSARDAVGVRQDNFSYRLLTPQFRPLSVAVTFPYLAVRDGLDMYHATFTPAPVSTRPLVFTMHCISSLAHPEFYKPLTALRLNWLLKKGMAKARHILCVSHTTRAHLIERYRIPAERLSVAYNGVTPGVRQVPPDEARARVRKVLGIEDPYFLYVGKLQAHKNIERLVRAYHVYRRNTQAPARLVVAGRAAGDSVDPMALAAELGIEDSVIRPGYVDSADLSALYSGARAFVFPSLWEGFGIPLLEAMNCGTPVISSSATCLPEIAGGAALLVDPFSIESIAEAMTTVDSSEETRNTLIRAGFNRAREFTWERCAAATLETYHRVAPTEEI